MVAKHIAHPGDGVTVTAAQTRVDAVAVRPDGRVRRQDGQPTAVGALADAESLHPLPPVPIPAELVVARKVSLQGLVDSAATSTRCRQACPAPRSVAGCG